MGIRNSLFSSTQRNVEAAQDCAATGSSSLTRQMRPHSVEELRREFDKLFAEMEFRCKRSALMNYDEAERYDNSSKWLQRTSSLIGAAGVGGVIVSIARTKRVAASRSGVFGIWALPLSAVLEFFSKGSSTLAPSAAERAKLHVAAGAGWQRIGRLSKVYRVQLRHLSDDAMEDGTLVAWYRELAEACEQVSVILPIRAEVYSKYEEPELVRGRIDKRELLLQRYLHLERSAPGREGDFADS